MSYEVQLDTTWDPVKALSNATKHGVTFVQAATVLLDAVALTTFDAAHSETEERWFTLGISSDGKMLVNTMNAQTTPIDNDDMPPEIDFAGAKRGQFYRAGAQLNVPVYLDQKVQATLAALASARGWTSRR